MTWDVVVAGSGPAGSVAAAVLSRAGVRVLVAERRRHPRPKPCAGVLSSRCVELLRSLDLDPGPATSQSLSGVVFTFRGRRPVRVDDPGAITADRGQLDAYLAARAREAGANIVEGQRVIGARPRDWGWEVETPAGAVRARAVIAADGCRGPTAVSLGLGFAFRLRGWGVEAVVGAPAEAVVDLGSVPGGYTWLFPRGGETSIGACSFLRGPASLVPVVRQMAEGLFPGHLLRIRGHPLPAMGGQRLCRGTALAAGDAAGIVDPLTGEGIYAAAFSGAAAAEALIRGLDDKDRGAVERGYRTAMRDFLADLRWGHRVATVVYRLPGMFQRRLVPDGRLSSCFRQLLAGRLAYRDVPLYLWRGDG